MKEPKSLATMQHLPYGIDDKTKELNSLTTMQQLPYGFDERN